MLEGIFPNGLVVIDKKTMGYLSAKNYLLKLGFTETELHDYLNDLKPLHIDALPYPEKEYDYWLK